MADRFKIHVILMGDPCLWRWDIVDDATGAVVRSSWSDEWTAYGSRDDASGAARERLDSVLGRKPPVRAGSNARSVPDAVTLRAASHAGS